MKYYKDRYGDEGTGEQKDTQESFKDTIKKMFDALSARIFGSSKPDNNKDGVQQRKTNGQDLKEESEKNGEKEVVDEIQSKEGDPMEEDIFSASKKDDNPEALDKGDSKKL